MACFVLYLLFIASWVDVQTSILRSSSETSSSKEDADLIIIVRRSYGNPYHPEDDVIDEFSDEDGDNLRGSKIGQLSDSERKFVEMKRLKINGQYFEITNNSHHGKSGEQ